MAQHLYICSDFPQHPTCSPEVDCGTEWTDTFQNWENGVLSDASRNNKSPHFRIMKFCFRVPFGVVLSGEQKLDNFVQKGGDLQALIGYVVNLNPLNSIDLQDGKPPIPNFNVPLGTEQPTQSPACSLKILRVYRGATGSVVCLLNSTIFLRTISILQVFNASHAMAKTDPKTTKRARKGGQRGKTGCATCR